MFDQLFSVENFISLVSLALMEVVLGIDNIIFVAILSQKVASGSRKRVRRLGISLALVLRIGLLLTLSWIMGLTKPLFHVMDHGFSGRDLVLLVGGLFLMAKATMEIHERMEQATHEGHEGVDGERPAPAAEGTAGFAATLVQILLLDIVFSLDSVITAVGMARAVEEAAGVAAKLGQTQK